MPDGELSPQARRRTWWPRAATPQWRWRRYWRDGRRANALGAVRCGQDWPGAAHTDALRKLAAQCALDEVDGTRDLAFYPGGRATSKAGSGAGDARVIE